jgi:hypothetical protein
MKIGLLIVVVFQAANSAFFAIIINLGMFLFSLGKKSRYLKVSSKTQVRIHAQKINIFG